MTQALIRTQARCDALESIAQVLGAQHGIDIEKMNEALQRATEEHHQRRLSEIEKLDPALAAILDNRPIVLPPGLFD